MGIAGIITLIVLGILLLFLEFFVIPGVTIFGIGGVIMLVLAIFFSYSNYGVSVGNYMLLGTFVSIGIVFYLTYRAGVWKKITLQSEIKGTSKADIGSSVKVGDVGKTVSRLAPMGTIAINSQFYEASSKGIFIDENTDIEIIRVLKNKIIVKPKN